MNLSPDTLKAPEFLSCSPQEFHNAIQQTLERWSYYLTQYTLDEYAQMKLFLEPEERKTGCAIKQSGELTSVFNRGKRGQGRYLIEHAIANGATHLDAFDGFLPTYYEQFGFEIVHREKNWVEGEPEVVFMRLKEDNKPIIHRPTFLSPTRIAEQRRYLAEVEGLEEDAIDKIIIDHLENIGKGIATGVVRHDLNSVLLPRT